MPKGPQGQKRPADVYRLRRPGGAAVGRAGGRGIAGAVRTSAKRTRGGEGSCA